MPAIWTRLYSLLAALFGAMAFLTSACATAEDAGASQRIVAVGDLHGDFEAYEQILQAAGVTDRRGRWTGGETILVQTGDIPDRGPDSRKIIEHLQKLQKRAVKKGGKVVTLVGNHEAMNMVNDLRYVHPGEYDAFKTRNSEALRAQIYEANRETIETAYLEDDPAMSSEAIREAWYGQWPLGKIEHRRAWAPGGDIGGWVAGNPAVVKVGDTLFVHGGLSAEYSAFTLDDINTRIKTALTTQDGTDESVLFDPLGPLWYRGNIYREETAPAEDNLESVENPAPARPSMEEEIDSVLAAQNAARLVVGHTPNVEGVRASLSGRVIQIDTGAAEYYGGVPSYLEIIGDQVIAHNADTGESRIISGGD